MPHRSSADHAKRVKVGFLLGACLFVVGTLGELAVHATPLDLPAWEEMLLFDAVVVGTLVAAGSVFVFGIALPLLE